MRAEVDANAERPLVLTFSPPREELPYLFDPERDTSDRANRQHLCERNGHGMECLVQKGNEHHSHLNGVRDDKPSQQPAILQDAQAQRRLRLQVADPYTLFGITKGQEVIRLLQDNGGRNASAGVRRMQGQ